jgi:hypothetical protein
MDNCNIIFKPFAYFLCFESLSYSSLKTDQRQSLSVIAETTTILSSYHNGNMKVFFADYM